MEQPSIAAVARTDVGHRRKKNEDSVLAKYPAFVVADGMGGHGLGDQASQKAVACFSDLPYEPLSYEVVESLCRQASHAVSAIDGEGRKPGTTLTGAVVSVVDGQWGWLVVNIGDSRTYLLREGVLTQITTDHSRVQELVDMGVISPEQMAERRDKNVITRAFGASSEPSTSVVDVFQLVMKDGDRLMMCSDGLYGMMSADRLAELVAIDDINDSCTALVQAALDGGGRDNISVVLADVDSVPQGPIDEQWLDEDEDDTAPVPCQEEA